MTKPSPFDVVSEAALENLASYPGMFVAAAHDEPILWTLPALFIVAIVVKAVPTPRRPRRRRSRW
jgi:hypothetical protein